LNKRKSKSVKTATHHVVNYSASSCTKQKHFKHYTNNVFLDNSASNNCKTGMCRQQVMPSKLD